MSKESTRINIGGAYIGGNVTAGGDVVGRDKTTINATQQTVDVEHFQALLAELRALIPEAGLAQRNARIIDADVAVVEAETSESKPNRAIIVSKLNSLTEILKASGNLTEAGQRLMPLAQKALEWGNQLFL